MHTCSVYGCMSSKRDKTLSFFSLPKDEVRRNQWLQAMGREDLMKRKYVRPATYLACALHFPLAMITVKKYLTPDALPTLLMPSFDDNGQPIANPDSNNTRLSLALGDTETLIKPMDPLSEEKKVFQAKVTQTESSFLLDRIVVHKRHSASQTEGISVSEREKKLFEMLRQSEKKRRKLEREVEELRAKLNRPSESDNDEESEEDDESESD